MSDLLTELREHDLPPRWDGLVVLWRGWEYQPSGVFLCPPPPPTCCEGCGAPDVHRGFPTKPANRGLVALRPSLTVEDLVYEEENRARLGSLYGKRKPRAFWRLHAYRCGECRLDTMWDTDTDEWWTLDHTDYGDDGSRA